MKRSLASQASPKDTILVSFWTPELESSGPEDQEPGTGTGAEGLTRRGPVARRILIRSKHDVALTLIDKWPVL